jgi:hypothetical protein
LSKLGGSGCSGSQGAHADQSQAPGCRPAAPLVCSSYTTISCLHLSRAARQYLSSSTDPTGADPLGAVTTLIPMPVGRGHGRYPADEATGRAAGAGGGPSALTAALRTTKSWRKMLLPTGTMGCALHMIHGLCPSHDPGTRLGQV